MKSALKGIDNISLRTACRFLYFSIVHAIIENEQQNIFQLKIDEYVTYYLGLCNIRVRGFELRSLFNN